MTAKKETPIEQTPPKCGLITPIAAMDGCSEAHWEEVRLIIKEALLDTPFTVELVSDSNEIGIIQKRIVENIYYNDMVICDVSGKNPNVMFELGMRLAFDKPTIIIKDDKTNYSFDTAPIEHIEYPRDLHYLSIQKFKTKLKTKVIATFEASKKPEHTTFLKHFGQFVTSKIEDKPVGVEQFIVEALSDMKNDIKQLRTEQRTDKNFAINTKISPIFQDVIATFVRNHIKNSHRDILDMSEEEIPLVTNEIAKDFLAQTKIGGTNLYPRASIISAIESALINELL